MDSLQKEIEKRQRQIPQTYKEAISRTETIQEIHRLYDVCLLDFDLFSSLTNKSILFSEL